jgi:UDP-N-acetyl-D-mannosaminouronate:lipid I N-acetyl-D-mannosaminouronosyltransferase
MCHINNINIYPFKNDSELLEYIDNQKKILVALNAEKIVKADDLMKQIVNSNIGYADGNGVVWALKRKGCDNIIKIPGCELWLKIIERYYRNKSFYLIGGEQEIIEKTVRKLTSEFKGINIVNFHNGYFDGIEKEIIVQDIKEKKPDVIFVALGSPRQEIFMNELLSIHPALYQGLGGSFDIYVGNSERAPKWWIDHGLEFAYRLIKKPSRIKRQIYYIKYIIFVLLNKY